MLSASLNKTFPSFLSIFVLCLITIFRSGVGTSGSLQTLFYAEVTDSMRVSSGGGVAEEGEMIEVVEIPVTEARSLIMDENVVKPIHLMFALMWFYENKWKQ